MKAKLVELPTPEDEDVIAMSTYQQFLNEFYDFVFGDGEVTREQALNKVTLYRDLIGVAANQKQLQKFFQTAKKTLLIHKTLIKLKNLKNLKTLEDFGDGDGDFTTASNDSPEGFDDTEPVNEETTRT